MPEKIVREVVSALKQRFRGPAVEIPIAMREEPAVTLFPGLVEEEPPIPDADALGGFGEFGQSLGAGAGLGTLPGLSESFSDGSGDDLFAPEEEPVTPDLNF